MITDLNVLTKSKRYPSKLLGKQQRDMAKTCRFKSIILYL